MRTFFPSLLLVALIVSTLSAWILYRQLSILVDGGFRLGNVLEYFCTLPNGILIVELSLGCWVVAMAWEEIRGEKTRGLE